MLSTVALNVVKEKPGDGRKEHPSFDSTVQWLRRVSDMFAKLPEEVIVQLVAHCSYVSVPPNTVIIKQGDKADSFYAVLDGPASAWLLPPTGEDDVGTKLATISQGQKLGAVEKHKLGICVKRYAAGGTFGELALLTPDGVRNATVISEAEPCQLATIDRDLYDKLLSRYQRAEYEERLSLCSNTPMFSALSKNHRIKLANAMEKVYMEFDNFISIQSQPANFLYFILKGNAKIIVDPELHMHQNNVLLEINSMLTVTVRRQIQARKNGMRANRSSMGAIMMLTSAGGGITFKDNVLSKYEQHQKLARAKTAISLASQRKSHVVKPGVQEVCWIRPGEVIGDTEAVLGLTTNLWSVIAAESMELYALSMQNFKRIFNLYRNNDAVALAAERECYRRVGERMRRIDTPLCARLSDHLRVNLEEAAQFQHEMSRPKVAPTPAQKDWSEALEAFRRRRMETASARQRIWRPPKPCVDRQTIQDMYNEWQQEVKRAAMLADENSEATKALTKEERKSRWLHQCNCQLKLQLAVTARHLNKFTNKFHVPKSEEEAAQENDGLYI